MEAIKHELVTCPKCGQIFECKVGSILLCQCSAIELGEPERDYIKEQYADCLCVACMKELKAEYHNKKLKNKIRKLLGIFDWRE